MISRAFAQFMSASLIITSHSYIPSQKSFVNNPLLPIYMRSIAWHDMWSRTFLTCKVIKWLQIYMRSNMTWRLMFKGWTLWTNVHRQISNHSCVETDSYQKLHDTLPRYHRSFRVRYEHAVLEAKPCHNNPLFVHCSLSIARFVNRCPLFNLNWFDCFNISMIRFHFISFYCQQ